MKLWNLDISWRSSSGSDEQQLARLYRKLRHFGVSRSTARSTVEDLRGDLPEAKSLAALTGENLDTFAASIAREHGRAPVSGHHSLIVVSMAIPLLSVAFFTYVWIAGGGPALGLGFHSVILTEHQTVRYEDGSVRTTEVEDPLFDEAFALIVFFLSTAFGVAGAFGLTAVNLALVRDSRIGATFKRMLVTLPIGGVMGIIAAILLGASTDYSDAPRVILAEVMLASAFIASAMVVAFRVVGAQFAFAREWARRLPRQDRHPAAPVARLIPSSDA